MISYRIMVDTRCYGGSNDKNKAIASAQLWSERRPDSFVRVEQVEKIWDNGKSPSYQINKILRDKP